MKFVMKGEQGSGKTTFIDLLLGRKFEKKYQATLGLSLETVKVNNEGKVEFWDMSGDPSDSQLTTWYDKHHEKTDVFFYCVDLSQHLNTTDINKKLSQLKESYPDAIIILVGTKVDKLKETTTIKAEFKAAVQKKLEPFKENVHETLITSAKDGYISCKTLPNLLTIIENSKPKLDEQKAERQRQEEEKQRRDEIHNDSKYPNSYKSIWKKTENQHSELTQSKQDYHCTVQLLRDYCKTNPSDSILFSKVKLMFSFKLRNHTTTIRQFLQEYERSSGREENVDALLKALSKKLKGQPIDVEGSLYRRLDYIQKLTQSTSVAFGEKFAENVGRTINPPY